MRRVSVYGWARTRLMTLTFRNCEKWAILIGTNSSWMHSWRCCIRLFMGVIDTIVSHWILIACAVSALCPTIRDSCENSSFDFTSIFVCFSVAVICQRMIKCMFTCFQCKKKIYRLQNTPSSPIENPKKVKKIDSRLLRIELRLEKERIVPK